MDYSILLNFLIKTIYLWSSYAFKRGKSMNILKSRCTSILKVEILIQDKVVFNEINISFMKVYTHCAQYLTPHSKVFLCFEIVLTRHLSESLCDTKGRGYLDRKELLSLCHKLNLDDQANQIADRILGHVNQQHVAIRY
ncbi:hypothetical protein KUTeg_013182 [Tegillarca granosa]|uniref:EF-hand domain-containing protein n=1 Tax=Tegillarca granosa TaxID=220873 RepID=A0ABQ9EYF0_TEGGR|nr:hypothetical protein KUTeg_013182 [Tegillarca granosa]